MTMMQCRKKDGKCYKMRTITISVSGGSILGYKKSIPKEIGRSQSCLCPKYSKRLRVSISHHFLRLLCLLQHGDGVGAGEYSINRDGGTTEDFVKFLFVSNRMLDITRNDTFLFVVPTGDTRYTQ